MVRLSGKVAIVTGAGTGQGEAEARLFADEGAKVLVADVNLPSAQKVAEGINAKNPNGALAISLDVSKEADWAKAMQVAADSFGPVTILVNNAGILGAATYDVLTHEHWSRIMDVNAWGQMAGMQSVIPVMKEAGGGSIVNVSSLAVVNACGRFTAYTASKGAVDAITRAAAIELAGFNIRVNSIAPGVIHTAMVEEAFPTKEAMDAAAAVQPLRRFGRPIDVAYLALYLASDESHFTTGARHVIDGGLSVMGGVSPDLGDG